MPSKKFDKIPSDLKFDQYERKFIFCDEKKRKEWEELDTGTKKFIENNLLRCCRDMENSLSIETLANICMDLIERIEKLESQHGKEMV